MTRTHRFLSMFGVSLVLATGSALPASAQDLTAGDWKWRATLYGWFPSVEGSTSHPPPANGSTINLDLEDYLDNLRFVFFAAFEARKGKVGAFTDFIYLNLDAEKGATRNLTLSGPFGRIELPAGVDAGVDLTLKAWVWTLAGTYTAIEQPDYELQLLGGFRYLKVKEVIDWRFQGNVGALPPVSLTGSATDEPDVWDAIVGVKGRYNFGDGRRWFVPYYFDIGTGQSDSTWQAMIGIGYVFDWGEVFAAYRHLNYKFDAKEGLQDLSLSGPGIAASFRF